MSPFLKMSPRALAESFMSLRVTLRLMLFKHSIFLAQADAIKQMHATIFCGQVFIKSEDALDDIYKMETFVERNHHVRAESLKPLEESASLKDNYDA
jgi:hypothetical protein